MVTHLIMARENLLSLFEIKKKEQEEDSNEPHLAILLMINKALLY